MDIKDIAFELGLNNSASVQDIRSKLRSNYFYHCSFFFSSECQCTEEWNYYIDKDESLIKSFNSLVTDEYRIDL